MGDVSSQPNEKVFGTQTVDFLFSLSEVQEEGELSPSVLLSLGKG